MIDNGDLHAILTSISTENSNHGCSNTNKKSKLLKQ